MTTFTGIHCYFGGAGYGSPGDDRTDFELTTKEIDALIADEDADADLPSLVRGTDFEDVKLHLTDFGYYVDHGIGDTILVIAETEKLATDLYIKDMYNDKQVVTYPKKKKPKTNHVVKRVMKDVLGEFGIDKRIQCRDAILAALALKGDAAKEKLQELTETDSDVKFEVTCGFFNTIGNYIDRKFKDWGWEKSKRRKIYESVERERWYQIRYGKSTFANEGGKQLVDNMPGSVVDMLDYADEIGMRWLQKLKQDVVRDAEFRVWLARTYLFCNLLNRISAADWRIVKKSEEFQSYMKRLSAEPTAYSSRGKSPRAICWGQRKD